MPYWACGCVEKCDPWAWVRKEKKKLSCVKLAIGPDHPRRHSPLKFCMPGRVREIVIYFKFHENRLRGLGAIRGRKSPTPIDKAHGLYKKNSLYYCTSRDVYSIDCIRCARHQIIERIYIAYVCKHWHRCRWKNVIQIWASKVLGQKIKPKFDFQIWKWHSACFDY